MWLARRLCRSGLFVWLAVAGFAARDVQAQTVGDTIDRFWNLYNARRYVEAEKTASSLLAYHQRNNQTPGIGMACVMLGKAIEKQERYDQAEQYYRSALKLLPDPEAAQLISQTTYSLAWLLKSQSRWDDAEKFYQAYLTRIEAEQGQSSGELVAPLAEMADTARERLQLEKAEQLLVRARTIAEQQTPVPDYQLACIVRTQALVRSRQRRIDDAERLLRDALARFEQIKDDNGVAIASEDLALLLYPQLRFREAEEFAKRAYRQRLEQFGAGHSSTANLQNTLGRIYARQGRLADAERFFKLALETRIKTLGPEHGKVSVTLVDLADAYLAQFRFAEAVPLLVRSLEIDEKVFDANHQVSLPNLASLGHAFLQLGRLNEAVATAKRSLEIIGPENSAAGPGHAALGQIYLQRGEHEAAEQAYLKANELNERFVRETGKPFHSTVAPAIRGLGRVYHVTGRYDLARAKFDKVIESLSADNVDSHQLCLAYWDRARTHRANGAIAAAVADLLKAMELAEQMRGQFSGSDVDRSASFMNATVVFEDMVSAQTEAGDVAMALNAMERARNQSLLDQMAAHGIDLLDGVPAEQRTELERRLATAGVRISTAQRQLEDLFGDEKLSANQRSVRAAPIQRELSAARDEYVSVEADIRNASPAYRLAVSQQHEPVSLESLQTFVTARKGLLLRYLIGDSDSFVVIVPADGQPQLVELTVTDEASRALGIAAGKLDERKLATALHNQEKLGVLQQLRESDRPDMERQVVTKLAALWQLLIPQSAKELIERGGSERLMIVPDGDLAMLPFEALAVTGGAEPKYLLDVGPPVLYGPSATILCNLSERATAGGKVRQVLTVGDPAYDAAAGGSNASRGRAVASSTHRAVTGQLGRLPYSGLEANWIEQTFAKSGAAVSKLTGAAASEGAIRQQLMGKQLIHFACHGLVDPQYGNLFGALAIAPGNRGGQLDDGFLTLAEIYQLNLHEAELTILSACDTNVGPGQIGEGVWALSRGFLVAGSRRVMASNWVVDDRAGATLISYYSNFLARASDGGDCDYAKALRDAKLLLRNDERWRSPFYWSSLVLMGPN